MTERRVLLLVVAIYVLARLPGLLAIPLFNDEAVYLVRAAAFPAALRTTLADGKLIQELALAALAPLPVAPLLPGRLLSVGCGALTVVGLALSGRALGSAGGGLLAALLYATAPLPALHDRLAIPDSMLACASTYLLLGSIRYAGGPAPGRREAGLLGLVLGAAALVKLPGLFLAATPALATLTLPTLQAERLGRLAQLRTALLVALLLIAMLAPLHYGGAEQGKLGGTSLSERLGLMVANGADVGGWLARYLPAPLLALPLATLFLRGAGEAPLPRAMIFLLGAGLALHVIFLIVGSRVVPRYLMPAWPPLLLAAGVAGVELWRAGGSGRAPRRLFVAAAVGSSVAWGAWFAWHLARNPLAAPLAEVDRRQYLETWSAGHHLGVLLEEIRSVGRGGGVVVANHDQPRLLHLATVLYLREDPSVRLVSVDLTQPDAAEQLRAAAQGRPLLVPLDEQEQQAFDVERRLPELAVRRVVESPGGTMRFYLYELR